MDYTYIKDDQTIKLTDSISDELVMSIPKKYDSWDDARQEQRDDALRLRDEIYGKNYETAEKGKDWKSHCKLPDIYEKRDTLKAHLWANIYQNPDSMFDVQGKDAISEKQAPIQKAALSDSFENMDIEFELDKMVDNLIEVGDMCLFVGWDTKTKQVRRKKTRVEQFKDRLIGMFTQMTGNAMLAEDKFAKTLLNPSSFVTYDELVYDGAKVKAVDPLNFVFDTAHSDFDRAGKIYRTFASVEEITSNKKYKLSKEDISDLKSLSTETNEVNNNLETDFDDKAIRGKQVEILEYWGDYTLQDGTILNNWLMVVVGRKYLVRFETNPYIINPFIFGNILSDPETKRGISPLRIAIVLNQMANEIFNTNMDILKLMQNPPYLAPKGAIQGQQNVAPGKMVEYDATLMPNIPVPLDFSKGLQGWEFINYFETMIESTTGINKYLAGDLGGQKVDFATEAQGIMTGGNTRMSLIIKQINMKMIVPMVEKVADLLANFKTDAETIKAKVDGQNEFTQITEDVRQASYKYTYGDRTAIAERKQHLQELSGIIREFAQVPQVAQQLNWIELFKFALEQYGFDNLEKLINQQPQQMLMAGGFNGQIPMQSNMGAIAGQGQLGINAGVPQTGAI